MSNGAKKARVPYEEYLRQERLDIMYSSDARVRSRATNMTTYPDVTVVCGRPETDPEDPEALTNPTVLIEVLSPSTEFLRSACWRAAHAREHRLHDQHRRDLQNASRFGRMMK